jgi:hypothetical protein
MGYANPLMPGVDSPSPIPPRTGAPTWNPNSSSTTGNHRPRQANVNAGKTDRHGAVPADDPWARPREPENEHATTTYHAPRHGAAPSPAEDRTAGPRELEDEHGATLSMGHHRALAHVSASPHGVAHLYEPPPFIPPSLTTEDEGGQQRERQRSRKWPESSSDEDYDSATSDGMDIDSLSDLDSTPAMLGKGKGVAVAPAPQPTNTQTYSQMAASPSNSAQSSVLTTAYRQQGPSYDSQWERWAPQSTFGNSKQNYPALHRKPSKCIVGLRLHIPYELIWPTYLQGL